MNVISIFKGISTPIPELVQKLQEQGWELGKVQFKQGQFVAEATNPYGETLQKTGPDEQTAIGAVVLAVARKNHMRSHAMWKVGMWSTSWHDKLRDIADAYRSAPIYDPKAVAAYKVLGDDSEHRLDVLKQHLHIEPTNDPAPYKTADDMRKDVHEKRHYYQSLYGLDHPVWTPQQHAAFRTVHDVLGHGVGGGQYDWPGRSLATAAHMPLLDPTSQQALFTEAIGRHAHNQVYGPGPHKVTILSDFIDGPIKDENPPGHWGVHPSQVIPPSAAPRFEHTAAGGSIDVNKNWSPNVEPLGTNAFAHHGDPLEGKRVMDNASLIDTNWSNLKDGSGKDNRALMKQAIVNAFRVVLLSPRKDLRWNAVHYQDISHLPGDEDNPKTYWDTLESSRQKWNSAQGIDPKAHMIYYKYLKPFASVIYAKNPQLGPLGAQEEADKELFRWWTQEQEKIMEEDALKPEDKQRGADEIERRANEALARRLKEYLKPKNEKTDHLDDQMSMFGAVEPQVLEVNALGDPMGDLEQRRPYLHDINRHVVYLGPEGYHHGQIAHHAHGAGLEEGYVDGKLIGNYSHSHDDSANQAVAKHLGIKYVPYDPEPNLDEYTAAVPQYNLLTGEEASKYGAFMGTHLKAISAISKHADEILNAALEDVREHDATGHHFRHAVLSLGVSGVGPKVCSFAWLLLQPMTSQLGTIDTHMMDVLGHNYEKEMNNRDYFKFERELAAGRNAAGYSHIPLGAFQWGMWDYKRTGAGSHQDHSAMRVLDPKPHLEVDWVGKAQNLKGEAWHEQGPDWWQNTKEARDQISEDWDKTYGKNFKSDSIPYVPATYSKVASDLGGMIPWFTHPMTGQEKHGAPGQTLMHHLRFHHPDLDTEDIWRQFADQHVQKRPANESWDESTLLGEDHNSIDPQAESDQNWTL